MASSGLALTGCVVDLHQGLVFPHASDAPLRLTRRERALLGYLVERSPRPVSREELLATVWGYAASVASRACDVAICRVRDKIEVDPAAPDHLLTAHGSGYQLVLPAARPAPEPGPATPWLLLGDVRLDLAGLRIEGPNGAASLTANEASLLDALVDANGAVVDRAALTRRVWGWVPGAGRRLDTLVSRVRAKLEADPTAPRLLKTAIRGGYQLLRTPDATPQDPPQHALPALPALPIDRAFGADAGLDALAAHLDRERLVTVLGPAGIGKTRLALAAAARRRTEGRLVAWIDAAQATTGSGLLTAVALGVDPSAGSGLDAVGDALALGQALAAYGPLLLALDNLEQLGAAAGDVIGALLARAPALTVLVTSRAPLRIAGERLVTVGPLDVADAVALFADRAIRPPTDADAAEVEALVHTLDGVPLAIELAAARTAALSPAELHARVRAGIDALVRRDPRRPQRHQSLRASLDASFELLSPSARRVLPRLSVLEGSFPLAAAEAVAGLGGDDPDPLEVLEELADWSLVRTGTDGWGLPVPIRQYAAERLDSAERLGAEQRHGAFFASPTDDVFGPDELAVMARLASEMPNRLAAIARAIGRGDGTVALGAMLGAFYVWIRVGPVRPGIAFAERIAELALSPIERAALERHWALLLATAAEYSAAQAHLDRARPLDASPAGLHQLAVADAVIASNLGRAGEALAAAREALRWTTPDDPTPRCRALILVAREATAAGEPAAASAALIEAERLAADHAGPTLRRDLAERRELLALMRGARAGAPSRPIADDAPALHHQAMLARLAGRPAEAVELGLAAAAAYARLGDRLHRAISVKEVGTAQIELGQLDLADQAIHEALSEAEALGVDVTCAHALHALGFVALERGDLLRSEALVRDAIARAPGPEPVAMFRAALGWVLWRMRRDEEASAELDAAAADPRLRSYVLVLLGDVRAEQGRLVEARALLDEARALSGPIQILADQASTSLAGVLARLGQLDAAEALLADVAQRPSLAPTRRAAHALANAELALARGEHDLAYRALATVPADPRIVGPRWAEVERALDDAVGGAETPP